MVDDLTKQQDWIPLYIRFSKTAAKIDIFMDADLAVIAAANCWRILVTRQRITTPGPEVKQYWKWDACAGGAKRHDCRQLAWQLTSCGFCQKLSSGAHPSQGSKPLVIWLVYDEGIHHLWTLMVDIVDITPESHFDHFDPCRSWCLAYNYIYN